MKYLPTWNHLEVINSIYLIAAVVTVYIVLFAGNLDMKGIMRSVKKSDLEKISIRNCEELMKECKYQTKLVSGERAQLPNLAV